MGKRRKVSNLLALALLGLLASGSPMHPYQMATLLRRTGKDQDMNIKWGSLYTVVQNLEKHGFIKAGASAREGRRPERTVYTITDAGRDELKDWLRELVTVPEAEYPRFEAALSVVTVLSPDEVVPLLEQRLTALDRMIAAQREALAQSAFVPAIFLIEAEYALAMREAEAAWVGRLRAQMRDGTLPGIADWRDYHRTGRVPEEFDKLWQELLSEGGAAPS